MTHNRKQKNKYQHASLTSAKKKSIMKASFEYMKTYESHSSKEHEFMNLVIMYTTISDSTGFSRSVPKSYPIDFSTSKHSINLRLDRRKSELSFSDRGKVCSKDRAAARAHSVQNKWTGRNKLSGFDVFHQSSSFT